MNKIIEKLTQERNELQGNHNRLLSFIKEGKHLELSKIQGDLLVIQSGIMASYINILNLRMECIIE